MLDRNIVEAMLNVYEWWLCPGDCEAKEQRKRLTGSSTNISNFSLMLFSITRINYIERKNYELSSFFSKV